MQSVVGDGEGEEPRRNTSKRDVRRMGRERREGHGQQYRGKRIQERQRPDKCAARANDRIRVLPTKPRTAGKPQMREIRDRPGMQAVPGDDRTPDAYQDRRGHPRLDLCDVPAPLGRAINAARHGPQLSTAARFARSLTG